MKRVALLGMPNTGKSTFFNRLTGASARTGNWPGVTVSLLSARVLLGGHMVQVVDLPGIYDLQGFSEDEEVVRRFLANNEIDLVLIILNTSQIERQLSLVLQLKSLGLPAMLLLNMADEAKKLGITVDTAEMGRLLDMPVVQLSAKYGQGFQGAYQAISQAVQAADAARPALAQAALAGLPAVDADMDRIMSRAVHIPAQLSNRLTERLDHILLHPWLGLPIFFLSMFLLFKAVFALGTPLQDGTGWLFDHFRLAVLDPLLSPLPKPVSGLLLDGVYNGVSTVASFVPLIILFFWFMTIVEDTGYLSRAAFLMDALMSRMGLDGRSFVMLLMGFGCNVPALMGTRVMRSRALRLLTMLVIPFSLCSARLQVFVFLTAALFSPHTAPIVLFSLYLMSFATVFLTAMMFKGKYKSNEPFVLEMPPYRFPTLRQMALRGWHEVRHFLHRANKFIIGGVVLVWLLTHIPFSAAPASAHTLAGILGNLLEPIFHPLGISPQLVVALIFGFVAKEVVIGALAVIYSSEGAHLMHVMAQQLDWVQAYSFMLFTLIYTPCLSTIATLKGEARSKAFTLLALAWPLTLAWLVSFAFYQAARALGY